MRSLSSCAGLTRASILSRRAIDCRVKPGNDDAERLPLGKPVKRREVIALLGGAAAWPLMARAQQPERMRRIGVLTGTDTQRVLAFTEGLRKLGWMDGRNIRIELRATNDPALLPAYAAELVGLAPDVIFASSPATLSPMQQATRTIPIVFATVSDPVALGFVPSLARPGGNITGFAHLEFTIATKRLELLKEIAPGVTRVAVIFDPANPASSGYVTELERAAPTLGFELSRAPVHGADEIESAVDALARKPNGGLFVVAGPAIGVRRELIIASAARHRLPAVYQFRYFVADGGLMYYGVDDIDSCRQAATYVDRILRGEKPGDLPIQTPIKFELVINLKAAKAIGLTVPLTLLARADEVIE